MIVKVSNDKLNKLNRPVYESSEKACQVIFFVGGVYDDDVTFFKEVLI